MLETKACNVTIAGCVGDHPCKSGQLERCVIERDHVASFKIPRARRIDS